MKLSNYERLLKLSEEVFDMRNDPQQMQVDEAVIARLLQLHPSAVTQYDEGDGPICWLIIIPTTKDLMFSFLDRDLNEQELFEQTKPEMKFDAIYLCSVLLLEEYRGKGIAKNLALKAIGDIQKTHKIDWLFGWFFSEAGIATAHALEKETGLPLLDIWH